MEKSQHHDHRNLNSRATRAYRRSRVLTAEQWDVIAKFLKKLAAAMRNSFAAFDERRPKDVTTLSDLIRADQEVERQRLVREQQAVDEGVEP